MIGVNITWERPERVRNQTHCSHGHEYTKENTRIGFKKNGRYQRICRKCAKDKQQRYRKNHSIPKIKRASISSTPDLLQADEIIETRRRWRKNRLTMSGQKVLCLCAGGAVRSVTLAFVLKYRYGMDALSASLERNAETSLKMLYEWADRIIVVQLGMEDNVPVEYLDKVLVLDIGPDKWFCSLHPELMNICQILLEKAMAPTSS